MRNRMKGAVALAVLLPLVAPAQSTAQPASHAERLPLSAALERPAVPSEVADNAAADVEGTYRALDPVRLLDTRLGIGAPQGPVGRNATTAEVDLQVAGVGGVPATGVTAVVLNVTAVNAPGSNGDNAFVTVWPSTEPERETSNLNYREGEVRANLVTVALGTNGKVKLKNIAGTGHLLADVQGYYSATDGVAGGGYHPITPARSFDSREFFVPLGHGEDAYADVWVPALDPHLGRIDSVVVNITAVNPTASGYLTAWGEGDEPPVVSNINFSARKTAPNLAVVPVVVDEEGYPYIAVYNSAGETHVVVDVLGWYDAEGAATDGYRFEPTNPTRVLDTRLSIGGSPGAVGGWSSRTAPTAGVAAGARAVVANVTGVLPSRPTWLGVTPEPALPGSSTLNLEGYETRANLSVPATNSTNDAFSVFNAEGEVHVIVDVFGYFH